MKRKEKIYLQYRLPGENEEVLQVIEDCEREITKWQALHGQEKDKAERLQNQLDLTNEKLKRQLAQERINFRNQNHIRNQSPLGTTTKQDNPTVYAQKIARLEIELQKVNKRLEEEQLKNVQSYQYSNYLLDQLTQCQQQIQQQQQPPVHSNPPNDSLKKSIFKPNDLSPLKDKIEKQQDIIDSKFQSTGDQIKQQIQFLLQMGLVINPSRYSGLDVLVKAFPEQSKDYLQIIQDNQSTLLHDLSRLVQQQPILNKSINNTPTKSRLFQQQHSMDTINQTLTKQDPKEKIKLGTLSLSQFWLQHFEQLCTARTRVDLIVLVEQEGQFLVQQKHNLLNNFQQQSPEVLLSIPPMSQVTLNLVFSKLNSLSSRVDHSQNIYKSYIIATSGMEGTKENIIEVDLLEDQGIDDINYKGKLKYKLQMNKD